MNDEEAKLFIGKVDGLAAPILELIKTEVDSNDDDGIRVALMALSKATAIHMQAMFIGLELDEEKRAGVIDLFMGATMAALEDLEVYEKSENVMKKMMGKP